MPDALDELPNLQELPSTLPLFTAAGSLAQGDFAPSRLEFEGRFVNTGSLRRADIYAGLLDHRRALQDDGLSASSRQLLNGSFTTTKPEPGDIDLAVEVPLASNQRPPRPDEPIGRLLLGPHMKLQFSCDAYPIYVLPSDHPHYQQVTLASVRYWTKWFGRDRLGHPKGRVWANTGGLG